MSGDDGGPPTEFWVIYMMKQEEPCQVTNVRKGSVHSIEKEFEDSENTNCCIVKRPVLVNLLQTNLDEFDMTWLVTLRLSREDTM